MARPRSFDVDKALDKATALFWARGYDAVGIADLVEEMGILRGSLYKLWGSKRGLFLACFDHYSAQHVTPQIAQLGGVADDSQMDGHARIDAFFEVHDPRGCLMCNALAGIARSDQEVAARIEDRLNDMREAMISALGDRGDVADQADLLVQQYIGMRVGHRIGLFT